MITSGDEDGIRRGGKQCVCRPILRNLVVSLCQEDQAKSRQQVVGALQALQIL